MIQTSKSLRNFKLTRVQLITFHPCAVNWKILVHRPRKFLEIHTVNFWSNGKRPDSWSSSFMKVNFVRSIRTPLLAMKCSCKCLSIPFGSLASFCDSWKLCMRFRVLRYQQWGKSQKAAKALPFASHFGKIGVRSSYSSVASAGSPLSYHPLSSQQSWNIWIRIFHNFFVDLLCSKTSGALLPQLQVLMRTLSCPNSEKRLN